MLGGIAGPYCRIGSSSKGLPAAPHGSLKNRFLEILVGCDASRSRYVAHWCDDFGGQYSAVGYGKKNGDSVEFAFAYPDGPFYNTFTWIPAEKAWRFLMQSEEPGGKRRFFAEDTVRR